MGVITDADYDQITAKIPRRYKGQDTPVSDLNKLSISGGQNSEAMVQQSTGSSNLGRKVPPAPSPAPRKESPAPPAYIGVGQAEALYDYAGTDSSDLPFHVGQKITILEFINNGKNALKECLSWWLTKLDWWKGEIDGREGLFPSNYVRKTSDTGRSLEKVPYVQAQQYPVLPPTQYNSQQYQPVQYASAGPNTQVNYAQSGAPPQQTVAVVQDKKSGKLHSIGGKLGNAVVFGAGATSKHFHPRAGEAIEANTS